MKNNSFVEERNVEVEGLWLVRSKADIGKLKCSACLSGQKAEWREHPTMLEEPNTRAVCEQCGGVDVAVVTKQVETEVFGCKIF